MNESAGQGEQGPLRGDIVLGPGEGQTIPGTDAMTLKAPSEDPGGSIGFLEATSPPGTGSPRHVHHSCDELFYVLEGEFLVLVGERQVSALPGTFVFIPWGTVYAAKAIGTEPGKVLAAYIPGAWSGASRSSPSCAPSREKTQIGAWGGAGPWPR